MAGELYISCNKTAEPAGLLRINIVNRECNPYLDCDNNDESLDSILKRLINVDDEGNYLVNVCGCELIERTKLCETNSILVDDDTETEIYRMTVPASTLIDDVFVSGMCKGLFYNDGTVANEQPTIRIYYGGSLAIESVSMELGSIGTEYFMPFEFHFTAYPLNQASDSQLITGTYVVADGTAAAVGYPNMQSTGNSARKTSYLGAAAEDATTAQDIIITIQFSNVWGSSLYCISHFREIEY